MPAPWASPCAPRTNLNGFRRYTQKLNATIFRAAVAREFADALIKTRASARDHVVTEYWPQEEQERRLEAAWSEWSRFNIWQSGAAETHREQMGHVRTGCVTRAHSDILSDGHGSPIKGSHKTWNGLNRTFAGGVESLEAQGHDLVLRKNLRIAVKRDPASDFVASTYGSHHISLVLSAASDWNSIQFGLVWAEYIMLAPAVKREMAEAFIIEVSEDEIELAAPETIPAAMHEAARECPSNPTPRSIVDLTEDNSAGEAVAISEAKRPSAPQMTFGPVYLANDPADMLQHPNQALASHVPASRVSTGPGHQDAAFDRF
ncbi:hypothetical protein AURDEDRAFT_165697 [Auricularia subglabra TFB-10046 SS5]|nr:hypothetical protein AURDEDRAFT_165697 [Auricularia subglabra TFB-10046 SS5]